MILSTHWITNKIAIPFLCSAIDHQWAIKKAKQIIINVQAAPKTHPGGVQGALFRLSYQSDETPEPV